MAKINELMDKRIKERQEKCDHYHYDLAQIPAGTFCGKCGKINTQS
jgi:bacterioferritin-associated ferredoxin